MKYYTKEEVLKEIKRHAVECMNGDEFTPMTDVLRYLSKRYHIPVPTLKKNIFILARFSTRQVSIPSY